MMSEYLKAMLIRDAIGCGVGLVVMVVALFALRRDRQYQSRDV